MPTMFGLGLDWYVWPIGQYLLFGPAVPNLLPSVNFLNRIQEELGLITIFKNCDP